VVGPRLGGYRVTYFRLGLEKYPPFGEAVVGVDGRLLWSERRFRGDFGGDVALTFLRSGLTFALLIGLLVVFLKKYHAGEVGVETGGVLFGVMIGASLLLTALVATLAAYQTGLGGIDARQTTWAVCAFKFLLYDIPLSLLVFVAWSVGESTARERWGDRLASFDALLKRDAMNATVGAALLRGAAAAPAIAAATLLAGLPLLLSGKAFPAFGDASVVALGSSGASLSASSSRPWSASS
jgi:hypothetical protein